jgi:molybdopterin-guanine dinucleotide biosynthesis protein A
MTAYGPIVGVLLAGGRSSRFGGGDKSLAMLGGKTLIASAIERLAPQVEILVLNANGDPARFGKLALPVIADDASPGIGDFAGPLAGLLAGMEWAGAKHPKARYIVTAATDTPFFPRDLVARLAEASGGAKPAVASSASGVHPVFGLWPVALAGVLRADLVAGKHKALDWVREQNAVEVPFGPETIGGTAVDPFFNINRREDFAEAEALLGVQGA